MSMSHTDSYFSFDKKPRSAHHPDNESPTPLSPGSVEPPVPSTLLSTASGSALLSQGGSTETPMNLLSVSKALDRSRHKGSTTSPSQRQGHRLGSALRKFNLAPLLGGRRHSDRVRDEKSGEHDTNSTSGSDKTTPSHRAWFSDHTNPQTPTEPSTRPHRRLGISEPSPNHPTGRNRATHTLSLRHKTNRPIPKPLTLPLPSDRTLSFLPSEAQRVATPPDSAEPRLGSPPRSGGRDHHHHYHQRNNHHYLESRSQAIPRGQFSDDDDMFRRKVYNGHNNNNNNKEEDAVPIERRLGSLVVDEDIPEHFPSSPLCPRNGRHRDGGGGVCPYHG